MRPAPAGGWIRKSGFVCAVLACIALPALVAGANLDAPPMVGELERLQQAWQGSLGSRLAGQFELATLPAVSAWPESPDAQARLLGSARLAQVLALLALSMLIYLATLLARGRLAALSACVVFACLPAVMVHGYVLRPETAASVFAALALVLLQCMAFAVHSRRQGGWRRRLELALLALSSATAIGLAIGTLPSLGSALQVAIALLMLTALQLGLRGGRVGLRRGFLRLPAHAISGRMWAPTLAALMAFVMAMWCLHIALTAPALAVRPTVLDVTMWPDSAWPMVLVITVAGLGALSFVLRTGVRFGRRGRVGADLVLLVYCFTQLAYGFSSGQRYDPLPAAPALAILFGEGVLALAAWLAWMSKRRAGISPAPRR